MRTISNTKSAVSGATGSSAILVKKGDADVIARSGTLVHELISGISTVWFSTPTRTQKVRANGSIHGSN